MHVALLLFKSPPRRCTTPDGWNAPQRLELARMLPRAKPRKEGFGDKDLLVVFLGFSLPELLDFVNLSGVDLGYILQAHPLE